MGSAQRADAEGVDPHVFKQRAGLLRRQAVVPADSLHTDLRRAAQRAEHVLKSGGVGILLHEQQLIELRLLHGEAHHL